jgi:hypothetical protein
LSLIITNEEWLHYVQSQNLINIWWTTIYPFLHWMILSFARIPYTFTTCIWKRMKDCIMRLLRHEERLHMKRLTTKRPAIGR